ncbi:hypothetical protein H5P35_18470 [Mycobacterium haemophilum DSM 44634]|nr:hypothetical protein [Mycobacterium haemophilum DSM 44634]
MVTGLFAASSAVIVLYTKPFADILVTAGIELGIDGYLLVQWLTPPAL